MRLGVSALSVALFSSMVLTAQPPSFPAPLPPQIVVMPSTMAVLGMKEESPGKWKIELVNSSPRDIYVLAFRRYSDVPGNFASSWSYPLIPSGDTRNSYLQVDPLMPGDRRSPQRLEAERSFAISAIYEDGSCKGETEACFVALSQWQGRRIEASLELPVLTRALAAEEVNKALAALKDLPDEAETRVLIERQLDPRVAVPSGVGVPALNFASAEASSLRYDLQRELAPMIPVIPGVPRVKLEAFRSVLQRQVARCEAILAAGKNTIP